MDLLVIVLCLLSERFLVHKSAHNRFHWFLSYAHGVESRFPNLQANSLLVLMVLPLLLLVGAVLHTGGYLLFGIIGLLLDIAVFYYCIGPVNPFYPVHAKPVEEMVDKDIGDYLVKVNGELFAVLFWYLVLGSVGILAYRLISLSQGLTKLGRQATNLTNLLDWFPARMTALLYLLVGNFQAGYHHFSKLFFSAPGKNKKLISACGLAAIDNREQKTMLHAETLVEHATIVFLVFLALCTIVAWV